MRFYSVILSGSKVNFLVINKRQRDDEIEITVIFVDVILYISFRIQEMHTWYSNFVSITYIFYFFKYINTRVFVVCLKLNRTFVRL